MTYGELAQALGLSENHTKRLSREAGVSGKGHGRRKVILTHEQIQQIKNHHRTKRSYRRWV